LGSFQCSQRKLAECSPYAMAKKNMTPDMALNKMASVSGDKVHEPFMLLQKVFSNIKANPQEQKFRRLNTSSAKFQSELFCYKGAKEFLQCAGFVAGAEGVWELPSNAGVEFAEAYGALTRTYASITEISARAQMSSASDARWVEYDAAVKGGAVDGARAQVEQCGKGEPGKEALKLLEKILTNLRRFPDSKEHRTINLSGKAGQKLPAVLPFMKIVGFEVSADKAELKTLDIDKIERMAAMVYWALNPSQVILESSVTAQARPCGALLGLAVGDALGAPVAYMGRYPLAAVEVDKAFEMCGGGNMNVAPGQVTEDTELTLSLLDALAESSEVCKAQKMNPAKMDWEKIGDKVAEKYSDWAASMPFATNEAFRASFGCPGTAHEMEKRAAAGSMKLQTAGALMRCSPLAVWGVAAKITPAALAEAARADARLSHPNENVVNANAAYTLALAALIETPDRGSAIDVVKNWIKETEKEEDLTVLKDWLELALGDERLEFNPKAGAATSGECKVAFTHAFRHLKLGTSFEVAMRAIITGGGDTDTNAAIVGSMVGAAAGIKGIPERWVNAVLACQTDAGQPRPPNYHPSSISKMLSKLVFA